MRLEQEDIRRKVEPLLGRGEYVVDVRANAEKIRVVVDSLIGISIDECVQLHRAFLSSLPEDYTGSVEITSPGATAFLLRPEQWETAVGRQVMVWTKKGRQLSGRLVAVSPTRRFLSLAPGEKKNKGQLMWLSYHDIEKIKMMFS